MEAAARFYNPNTHAQPVNSYGRQQTYEAAGNYQFTSLPGPRGVRRRVLIRLVFAGFLELQLSGKDPGVVKESCNMVHVDEDRQRTCRLMEEAHREDGE